MVPAKFKIIGLDAVGFKGNIAETETTLEGNALLKARIINEKYKCSCIADDTGLEVNVLNGAPGVYSARFAGENCDPHANIHKLLKLLENEQDRSARFRTVIALIMNGTEHLFEGIVYGKIISEPRGTSGFGYDPVFQPEGYDLCFGEMSLAEKNRISHRAKAVEELMRFLSGLPLI